MKIRDRQEILDLLGKTFFTHCFKEAQKIRTGFLKSRGQFGPDLLLAVALAETRKELEEMKMILKALQVGGMGVALAMCGCGDSKPGVDGSRSNNVASIKLNASPEFVASSASGFLFSYKVSLAAQSGLTTSELFNGDARTVTLSFDNDLDPIQRGATQHDFTNKTCTVKIHGSLNPDLYPANSQIRAGIEGLLKWTLYHELGHAWGMAHAPRRDDVMYFSSSSDNTTEAAYAAHLKELDSFRKTGLSEGGSL